VSLGEYRFEGAGEVEMLTEGADGYVIADSVWFVPKR
jgi:hypothetical protein